MAGLLNWLEGIARRHLAPLRDITSGDARRAVEDRAAAHRASLTDLEAEVLRLSAQIQAQAEQEAIERQRGRDG